MVRMSAPVSKRWVAKQCRRVCGTDRFDDAGAARGGRDCALQNLLIQMVTLLPAISWVDAAPGSRENVLPARLPFCIGIFHCESGWERHCAMALRQIGFVQ